MNNIKSIQKLNEIEIKTSLVEKASWHDQYKDSPYIFVGGFNFELTEGDIITVYGEITDINLARDKNTGVSRGFGFLSYADQRSTVLAVDNLNGIKLSGRIIRVDHVLKYKSPEEVELERERRRKERTKYADLVTEELFKSATGYLMMAPPQELNNIESEVVDPEPSHTLITNDQSQLPHKRRRRTTEESELLSRYRKGEISEAEYLQEKGRLKKALKVVTHKI